MLSNVLDLDAGFRKVERNADIVRRLFPTIQHYRGKGKTLKTIYQVLLEEGELAMAFDSFRNCYYAQRKEEQSLNSSSIDSSKTYILAASPMKKKLEQKVKSEENDSASPAKKVRKIDTECESLEEYLAAHQAQAKAYFESR